MWRSVVLALGVLLTIPIAASGQTTLCDFQGDAVSKVNPTLLILHDPFVGRCDDGTELRADSGQVNQVTDEVQLVGNVYFRDAARTLTADNANYNRGTGRLYALGNVVLVDESAERRTIRGPELEYFRENETRSEALVYATQRPTLILEPDSSSEGTDSAEPLTLVGDRVDIVGNDDLTATGNVVITREDMRATAEEAHYDAAAESLELRQNAMISREGYSLVGEVIQTQLEDGALQYVQSRNAARLDGEELTVEAPDIQLFFEADTLHQVVARVPGGAQDERARAASKTFRMEADSIDAMFELGALHTVYAIGAARGETIDTTQAGANYLEMRSVPMDDSGPFAVQEPAQEAGPDVGPSAPPSPPIAVEEQRDSAAIAPAGEDDLAGSDAPGDLTDGGAEGDAEEASSPESIRAVTASDWIRGDTIIAYFFPVDSTGTEMVGGEPALDAAVALAPPVASAADPDEPVQVVDCGTEPCQEPVSEEEEETPELRKLIARNEAQSFYRLASETPGDPDCRNLSFLVGAEIELDVTDGELQVANVIGLEQGIYLEATGCTAPAASGEVPVQEEDDPAAPAEVPVQEEDDPAAGTEPLESAPVLNTER